jgi:hypothetical protein
MAADWFGAWRDRVDKQRVSRDDRWPVEAPTAKMYHKWISSLSLYSGLPLAVAAVCRKRLILAAFFGSTILD